MLPQCLKILYLMSVTQHKVIACVNIVEHCIALVSGIHQDRSVGVL